jgi:hypothetical protein
MTIALIASTVVNLALLLVVFVRGRDHDNALMDQAAVFAQATPDLTALLAANADLCQRIQAPEVAVRQHAAPSQDDLAALMPQPPMTDAEFWPDDMRDVLENGLYEQVPE